MIENYKRAGLLLKLSMILTISSVVFLNGTLSRGDTIGLMTIMAVIYVFAHLVQIGKRWTRSLVLIYAVASLFFATVDIFLLTVSNDPFEISVLKGASAIVPLSMVIWAAFLVTRKIPREQYDRSGIPTSDGSKP
jgi:hypothetical protein